MPHISDHDLERYHPAGVRSIGVEDGDCQFETAGDAPVAIAGSWLAIKVSI
jgi:hypothetical protein